MMTFMPLGCLGAHRNSWVFLKAALHGVACMQLHARACMHAVACTFLHLVRACTADFVCWCLCELPLLMHLCVRACTCACMRAHALCVAACRRARGASPRVFLGFFTASKTRRASPVPSRAAVTFVSPDAGATILRRGGGLCGVNTNARPPMSC